MACKKGAGWSSSKKDSLIDVEPMCGVLASDAHTSILITNTLKQRDDIPPRSTYGHASEWFHHSEAAGHHTVSVVGFSVCVALTCVSRIQRRL